MSDGDPERLERERQDAERRYNDALTTFDAALVRTKSTPGATFAADTTPPQTPGGWRGWRLRDVRQWLMPWMERQQAFNGRMAAALEALVSRERERADGFERFQSALIVFLQQITAFVETKDRQLAATSAGRIDEHQHVLDTLPDLRGQVAVLQRATQMLTRRLNEPTPHQSATAVAPASGAGGSPAPQFQSTDDYKYIAFEDQFRGSVEDIRAKLVEYLPIFKGASDVLDVGCGRGEFLALLESAGVSARGVDVNSEMVAAARDRGLHATTADGLAHLRSLADQSIGGLFAAQVVEHLEPPYLVRMLEAAFHKLRPGAPIVLETINPACWLAFFSSYLRDLTHVRPIHPETLEYLTRASGFGQVSIRYSAPVAEHSRMKIIDLPEEILTCADPTARAIVEAARVVNTNAAILNRLAFSYHDYAVIGYRS